MKRSASAIFLMACFTLALSAAAEEASTSRPSRDSDKSSLEFRRVFAPAESIKDWPLGSIPYLPITAKEFERLVEAAHENSSEVPAVRAVQLSGASYRARFAFPDVLQGEAVLEVAHRAKKNVFLPLEPCSLAISQAHWQSTPSQQAMLGYSSTNRTGVRVDRSDTLKLAWSLRGERDPTGGVTFQIELPPCTTGHLLLELPERLVPSVDRGLVTKGDLTGEDRQWQIDLGGSSRIALRLSPEQAGVQQQSLALLRQITSYDFAQHGVDVTAQIRLNVHGAPLKRLALKIDPGLQIVSARYADRDIPWATSVDPRADSKQVILELPEPITGKGRAIRLSALAPLRPRTLWRLPRIKAEDTIWLEETLRLVIPKPLTLEQIQPVRCRQMKTAALATPLSGDSLEFQSFGPDATIDVVVARPRESLHVDSGSTLEMGATEINCRTVTMWSLRQDERFELRAEVNSQWFIDSVTAPDEDIIDDWQLEVSDPKQPLLQVRLKKGVSSRRPVRLVVTGHRPTVPEGSLEIRELEMLRYSQDQIGKQWLAIHPADGHELQLSGADDLARIDPQKFSIPESRLFSEAPTGLVFSVDEAASRLRVALNGRKPSYSAETTIDVVIDGKALTETYLFRCTPQTAHVERLRIFFSHARPEPLRFTLAGASGGQLSAKLLGPEDLAELGASSAGEVWELSLRLPRGGAFEIRGVRTLPLEGVLPLSLAAIPDASSQRGTVMVRVLAESGVGIENHRLQSIPTELLEAGFYQTVRGTYRYEPSRDALSPDSAITVSPASAQPSESGAWAWQGCLDSRYALPESTVHVACWHIQTAGRGRVNFVLPREAMLRAVAVDGTMLPEAALPTARGRLSVDLPSGKQFATISLYFVTPGELPRLTNKVRPAWPQIDVPVFTRRWTIWLPESYELADSDSHLENLPLDSPTWSQRLFGPLGRSSRDSMFDPLSSDAWFEHVGTTAEANASRSPAERCMMAFGEILRFSGGEERPQSWGPIAERVVTALMSSGVNVLVDSQLLAESGITPESPLPKVNGDSSEQRGLVLLRKSKLFLLCHEQTVLLTSMAAISGYRSQFAAENGTFGGRILPGFLADELTMAIRSGGTERFVPLAAWAQSTAAGQSPWRFDPVDDDPSWESRGWQSYTLSTGDEVDASARIVRRDAMQSLAWAMFLCVLGLGAWKGRQHLAGLFVLLVVCAATAFIVSPAFLPLASAAFLGSLCGLAFEIVDRRERDTIPSHKALVNAPAMLLWLMTLTVGMAITADAADSIVSPRAVHRVVVPVASSGQVVGEKVYIPEELFKGLLACAAANGQSGDWMITRADYQAVLTREVSREVTSLKELKVIFDLQVFHPECKVSIPWPRDEQAFTPVGAKLDGHSIDVDWPAGQGSLSFVPDQMGMMQLELTFKPVFERDDNATGFEMAIPRIPISSLLVSCGGDPTPGLEIVDARGQAMTNLPRKEIRVELGSADRIALRWPENRNTNTTLSSVSVEELLWVKLQTGSPIIDARFKFQSLHGKMHRLQLLVDPQLQLLRSQNSGSAISKIQTIPGDPQVLELQLSSVGEESVTVDLSFLVSNASGIGNFRLPKLEATGARLSKRLMAVTLSPALEYEVQRDGDTTPLEPADFSTLWGESEEVPEFAFEVPRGEIGSLVITRPRQLRNEIEQIVSISMGQESALVRCDATVRISGGHNFQFRLNGPPGLEIQDISIMDEGVQRVARWAIDDAGTITVFMVGPTTARQQFELRGLLRAPKQGEIRVPSFQWIDAEMMTNELRVFRQASALVEITSAEGMSLIESVSKEINPDLGRLLACYSLEKPTATINLKLAPNAPQTRGRQVTIVERENDAWTATIDYQLEVRNGLVGQLWFDVPPEWVEPYQIDRNVQFTVSSIPGENKRRLILHPATPIAGDYQIRIRGGLTPGMGDRLRVPDVVPRGVAQIDRWVSLPHQQQLERIQWDTEGLIIAPFPPELQKHLSLPQGMQTFRVSGEYFQAQLKNIDRDARLPQVLLADIRMKWCSNGDCYGVATYDLEPAGAAQAVISMPLGLKLIHLTVAGLPAPVRPLGDNDWQFVLGFAQLPQRVEVVFSGMLPDIQQHRQAVQFHAPTLKGLTVDRTLWTVIAPTFVGPCEVLENIRVVTPLQQELARLQATRPVIDSAAHTTGEQLPEELRRWYAPWWSRLLTIHSRVQNLSLLGGPVNSVNNQDRESFNRDEVAIGERLGVSLSATPEGAQSIVEPSMLMSTAGVRKTWPTLCAVATDAPQLSVRYQQMDRTDFVWRMLLAAMIAGIGVSIANGWLRGRCLKVSPWLLTTIAATFWWLFLAPSVVGWLVLAVTMFAIVIRRLRARAIPHSATLQT